MDRGIHVHARPTAAAKKEMDYTFRAVRILSKRLAENGILISELDAIYCIVTSVFGYEMKYVACSYCGYPHWIVIGSASIHIAGISVPVAVDTLAIHR
jgi:hypothetical protein